MRHDRVRGRTSVRGGPGRRQAAVAPPSAADWPAWRGPEQRGSSPERGLPVRWSAQENVAFRLALPSAGAATPIVSGDRVFVTAVDGDSVWLWSVDRRKGTVSWKQPLGPATGHAHRKHNMASPSPGHRRQERLHADGHRHPQGASALDGKELWQRDLQKDYGAFGLNWGYASSPLLEGGTLYVPVLHGTNTDAPSYLLGVEAASGRTRFRVERPTDARAESPDAYTTPAVARKGGASEIVVTGGDVVTGHDPAHRRRAVARERAQPRPRGQLPHRGLAGGGGRPRDRAHPHQAHARAARVRTRRRHGNGALVLRPGARRAHARHRRHAAVRGDRPRRAHLPRPGQRAHRLRPPAPEGRRRTARRPCWRTASSTRPARTASPAS